MFLSAIHVYPVKSLRGVSLREGEVKPAGFRHDRRWMVVDTEGRFVSQREEPRLALVDVAVDDGNYALSIDGGSVEIPHHQEGTRSEVSVWGSTVAAVAHRAGGQFLSDWLGREVRLVHLPEDVVRPTNRGEPSDRVSFADGYPYLLIGQSSLDSLNSRVGGEPLSMDRFRPNLVVSGSEPHAEDEWERVKIGGVAFRGVKKCDRCVVTTIDPNTAKKGPEPLRTLAKYRRWDGKVWFGMNLCPDLEGTLRLGDEVSV